MKKETKEVIIAVAKEGIAKPAIESAYAWLDAWDRLLFGPRPSYIKPYSKNNGVWHPGVTILGGGKTFGEVEDNDKRVVSVNDCKNQFFDKLRKNLNPEETPIRKIDADKLLEKVMDAQDELDICSDDFTVVNDVYNRILDLINGELEED